MAQAIASKLLGSTVQIDSAGIETARGLPATTQAVQVMKDMGIDIAYHRSRSIYSIDLSQYDLIIAMTDFVAKKLLRRGVSQDCLRQLNIPDPYHKGIIEYKKTAQRLEEELRKLFNLHS